MQKIHQQLANSNVIISQAAPCGRKLPPKLIPKVNAIKIGLLIY
ncbi:MAG: hypothetical protein ACTSPA_07150 [Promethearchaeota archaeon]